MALFKSSWLILGIVLLVVGLLVQSDIFARLLDIVGWIIAIVGIIAIVVGLASLITSRSGSGY